MAEATDRKWGVWFLGSEENAPGWCEFNNGGGVGKPVTYQEAVCEKRTRERMYPNATFEVREVPPEGVPVEVVEKRELKPYVPPALRPISIPGLLGENLLTSQDALAKLLFFSERTIIRHVCEMADYGDATGTVGPFEVPLAPAILKTLERAWEIGSSAPEDAFTIEALMYRGAMKTAKDLFLLAEGLKAAGLKQI